MALSAVELVTSRKFLFDPGSGVETFERHYRIEGSNNPGDALATGPGYGDDIENGIGFDASPMVVIRRELTVIQDKGGGDGTLLLTVLYRYTYPQETGKAKYRWDTSAESEHIVQALSQTHYPVAANEPGEYVSVVSDNVEGVDVYVPKGEYTEFYDIASLSAAEKDRIMVLTGKVNSGGFRGWVAGEVLFVGATCEHQPTGRWNVAYRFLISPNRTVAGSDPIVVYCERSAQNENVEKGGWDYVWYTQVPKKDDVSHTVPKVVDSAHVAVVYETADLLHAATGLPGIDAD